MPLVGIKKILTKARDERYGVLSLLAGNLEMVIGQIAAAEEQRSPLILAFNQGVTPELPIELAMPFIAGAAEQASVPVATILDHGHGLEDIIPAMQFGSSSVMFDGSNLPYDENVRRTKEIVKIAHVFGVDVEAELGQIAGSSVQIDPDSTVTAAPQTEKPNDAFTDAELAADFVRRTGVDALAISLGNAHGSYQGTPNLNLDLVRKVHSLVDVPLVMHGASGLGDTAYTRIIDSGISKICYYTAMGNHVSNEIRQMLVDSEQNSTGYHETISRTIDFFRADTTRVMALVGCVGVA